MERTWYVWQGADKSGPFSNDELIQMKSAGKILPSTLIGRDESNRREAARIKGLFAEAELQGTSAPLPRSPAQGNSAVLPSRPSDVPGVVAWSQSEVLKKCEISRWWLGITVFIICASVLFLLQLYLLSRSSFLWFLASLAAIAGGMLVHQLLRDSQRVKEMMAPTAHNLGHANAIGLQVNQARGLAQGLMSLELPRGSQDSESSVLTLHPQYLMVSQLENDQLQLVWANEIERVEPRKVSIGTTSESHSSFSSTSSSSATAYGDTAVGVGSSSGQSHGKGFQEDVYNHKLVITTSNPSHPLITLDYLEDEEMWDFSRAALQQMVNGNARYDQAQVRLRSPQLNRSITDLRRWFTGDGSSQNWSQMSIPMKMGVVGLGIMLLTCLGGPIMGYLLNVAVLPAVAVSFPFRAAGLGDAAAAIAGLVVVLAVVGGFCFIPPLRAKLDGLLHNKSMRPVLATAISWPVVGQLGLCGLMLATQAAVQPPKGGDPDLVRDDRKDAQVPKDPIAVALSKSESDWKKLLTPGAGWKGKVTAGTQVSPAHFVIVDVPADSSEFVFVVESQEDVTKRGVFRGALKHVGMGNEQRFELHAQTDKDVAAWPIDYLFSTLALHRSGEKLECSHGLVVNLDQPVKPVLWKKEDVKRTLHEAFDAGTEWTGYEKPASQSAIEGRIAVTEVKNSGQSVEVLATADKSPLAAAVFKGQYREDGIGLWGYPVLLSRKAADAPLPQESGSGLLFWGDGDLSVGWRTDGKMIVLSRGVPFIAETKRRLPDFQPTPVRNVALFSAGSVWKGTWKSGNVPLQDVTLTVAEMRNDGAYIRLLLARDAAPHGAEVFIGKLDPERAGYSLTLQRKQAAPYLEHCQDLRLRIDPQGKCMGFTDRSAELILSLAPDNKHSAEELSTNKVAATLKSMFAQTRKSTGTLTKASDGNSVKVSVEFSPKPGAGNVVQAAISIPGGPKGRILFEGSLVTTDEAVNGYCLSMKKKTAGLAEATSQIFNQRTDNVDLWFRLDPDQRRVWGITNGDEFLLLDP